MAENAVATTTHQQEARVPALQAGGKLTAIIPQDAEQCFRMAKMICQSGMAPRDMNTPQQVVAAIFHGAEIGLPPMQAVQSIAVVNGRPTVWGDAAIGLVEASGLLEDFEERIEGGGEKMTAICRAKRKGRVSEIKHSFSVDDAKAAGLWGKQGPWKQYPKRMLQMRARSWVLRDGFADILKGLGIREEVQDFGGPVAYSERSEVSASALIAQARGVDDDEGVTVPQEPEPVTEDNLTDEERELFDDGPQQEAEQPDDDTDDGDPMLTLAESVAAKGSAALSNWFLEHGGSIEKEWIAEHKKALEVKAAAADGKAGQGALNV